MTDERLRPSVWIWDDDVNSLAWAIERIKTAECDVEVFDSFEKMLKKLTENSPIVFPHGILVDVLWPNGGGEASPDMGLCLIAVMAAALEGRTVVGALSSSAGLYQGSIAQAGGDFVIGKSGGSLNEIAMDAFIGALGSAPRKPHAALSEMRIQAPSSCRPKDEVTISVEFSGHTVDPFGGSITVSVRPEKGRALGREFYEYPETEMHAQQHTFWLEAPASPGQWVVGVVSSAEGYVLGYTETVISVTSML